MASELSTLADRYVLEVLVARGGMAAVWRARDDVLARPVAVKILHPHLAEDEAFLERFRFEALAAARLTHPNIVSIYDTGTDEPGGAGEQHFIVMEFCGGGSLADHLAEHGPIEPDEVRGIGAAVCDALGYAHRAEVIHRDVKPANLLITADGSLKVADFGIAKAAFVTGDITTTGSILGTVTYLSPEQLRGGEPDNRSDLYALGVTLYELVTGRPPFAEETQMATAMKHLREAPASPRSVRGGVPRSIDQVIMRALAKDPDDRYQSAEDMRTALEGRGSPSAATAIIDRPGPSVERIDTEPTRATRQISSTTRPIAPVLLLIAAAVVAAVVITALARNLGDETPPPSGGGNRQGSGEGGQSVLSVQGVNVLDPNGDGEHDDEAPLAYDEDTSTAWNTSSYQASFEAIGKSGVGLVFDLGDGAEVSGVRVTGCSDCGLSIGVADDTSTTDDTIFEPVDETDSFGGDAFQFELTSGRYWLVFITSLPGGGAGRASIAEVQFSGSSG